MCFVFFKQKTAYEMRISDWSSDVCSSDLLGGKSPFIVFEDADLDAAAEGLVDSIWFNQGQVCCAGSRLLVQESVEQRFLAKLRARMGHLIVGSPLDKSTHIGALVDPVPLQRIASLVQTARDEGCPVSQPACTLPTQGRFYPPTHAEGRRVGKERVS